MRTKKHILFFLLGALMAYVAVQVLRPDGGSYLLQAQGRLSSEEEQVIQVVKKIEPTVVTVSTQALIEGDWFSPSQAVQGQGSGVIVRPDGYILTNRHVVTMPQGATNSTVTVTLPNGREYKDARVLGTDPRSDLAIVKIPANNLPVAPLGNSDELQVGQKTIALGNPLGLNRTVTTGIVSALRRNITGDNGLLEGLIQTDASINPGNSGGALVDSSGRLIGINTAIASLRGGGSIGIGFAVPINTARAVLDDLQKYGRVRIPWLGLEYRDVPAGWVQAYGVPRGILVNPYPGSPAARAGVRRYDVITEVDGKKVDSGTALDEVLRRKNIGESVRFTVWRDGETRDVSLTLAERPQSLGI